MYFLGRTGLLTIGIGVVLLAILVGLGHVLWTRSAESEIVHYSWPVKWALTLAAKSPDLPTGSRFTTVSVRTVRGGDHWTVAGELELPSVNQSRLTTSYEATVKSLCSDVAERHCWEMEALTLGSVPATVPTGSERAPKAHVDTSSDTPILAELTSSSEEPAASTEPAKAMTEDEDLAFIFKEPSGKEAAGSPEQEDLEFILSEAHSGQSALEELENDIQSAEPKPAAPQYDPALVRRIQSGLAALGYDAGPVDGIVGRQTRTAIRILPPARAIGQRGYQCRVVGCHYQSARSVRGRPHPGRQPLSAPASPTGRCPQAAVELQLDQSEKSRLRGLGEFWSNTF